ARAAGRFRPARARRRGRVLLPAGDGARHPRFGPAVRAARDRVAASRRAEAVGPLPLLRLGRAREAGHRALGRRAAAAGRRRRRLALAIVVASGANFLVVDEPTNHLDLESREALEAALEAFPGTVLLVSHDRALLDAVAQRTLAIEDRQLNSYDGGWADYVREREARAAPPPVPEPKPAKPPKQRAPRKPT